MLTRVQLMLDADLDRRLADEARLRGVSKSELVRTILRRELAPRPESGHPFSELVGLVDGAPDDSASIDDVVYGPGGP